MHLMRQETAAYGARPKRLIAKSSSSSADPEGTRPHLGALLRGYFTDEGKLIYACRVGTGMSEKVLADLRRRLEAAKSR
jgi:ATP dependent DNA ligase C terminal region